MQNGDRHPAAEWRWSARCAEYERKDIWYSPDLADTTLAQSVCMDCPVRHACLIDGLDDEHGVWGGYTPTERARLRKYLPKESRARNESLIRAAYVGPALFGVADVTHPLRTKEK